MAHDVFISYAPGDQAVAESICAGLELKGILCWFAPRDVPVGEKRNETAFTALRKARLMLALVSSRSNASLHNYFEIELASMEPRPIIVLRLEDCTLPDGLKRLLSTSETIDMFGAPMEQRLPKLVEAARRIIGSDSAEMASFLDDSGGEDDSFAPKKDVAMTSRITHRIIAGAPIDLGQLFPDAKRPEQPKTNSDASTTNTALPLATVDKVHFSITSPRSVASGSSFVLDVWAHLESQRQEVLNRARDAAGLDEISARVKGPLKIARGKVLFVHLTIAGMSISEPHDTILWDGEIGNATFPVTVPVDAAAGSHAASAAISLDGFQIARLHFTVTVGAKKTEPHELAIDVKHHKSAFASYASVDREEVLARIQGMQKIAPDLKVFLDVLNLRSGQDWAKSLWEVIPQNDVFYLFWSAAAKASPWVEKEWKCALTTRGEEFIDPVPLVSPEQVRPPAELAHKHFNDWVLAFRRTSTS